MARRAEARSLLLDGSAVVMDASLVRILDFMYKVELFQKLDAEEILRLARAFTHREVADGDKIVSQGEEGSELFFIEAGSVSVRAGEEEREITTLSHGDYFGETALVQKAPRNASVVALGDVRLRVLSRDQFEEFDLHRKLQLDVRHSNMKTGLRQLLGDLVTMRTFCKVMLLIGSYFFVAILIFSNLEGWNWMDVVYFSIITLMTVPGHKQFECFLFPLFHWSLDISFDQHSKLSSVHVFKVYTRVEPSQVGYGDFAPQHWASRLTLVFFVLASLILVATSIGEFLEALVALELRNERARKALQLKQARVGMFDLGAQRRRWRRRTGSWIGALLGLLVVCSLLAKGMVLANGHTWVDALYFSVVTLSTIGYGDLTPGKEPGSRAVVGIMVLVGVPLFAMMLARLVEIAYGRAKAHGQLPAVVGGLTNEKFDQIIEFTDKLWRAGGYNSKPQDEMALCLQLIFFDLVLLVTKSCFYCLALVS